MQDEIDKSELVGAYPVCDSCRGRNVRCKAWAGWHVPTGCWQVAQVFEAAHCQDCDRSCGLTWRIDRAFRKQRIRRLNDQVRHGDLRNATVVVTQGVKAWGATFLMKAADAIVAFDTFTDKNDPRGEHDFGAIEVAGQKIFWKIDYFDLALNAHSPDPANREVTHRVLTIMLASEY